MKKWFIFLWIQKSLVKLNIQTNNRSLQLKCRRWESEQHEKCNCSNIRTLRTAANSIISLLIKNSSISASSHSEFQNRLICSQHIVFRYILFGSVVKEFVLIFQNFKENNYIVLYSKITEFIIDVENVRLQIICII